MPSFSLIGALEFSRVVSELQQQSASSTLSLFESPLTPYPGGHYHTHRGSRPRSPDPEHERNPWDAALHGLPLNDRSPRGHLPNLSESITEEVIAPEGQTPMITITHTPASPLSDVTSDAPSTPAPPGKRQRLYRVLAHSYHVLFPTLHHFKSKTFLGKIAAVFAAPAVMALTLTLPVVVTDYEGFGEREEKLVVDEGRLIDFEEEGVARTLIAEDQIEEELHELKFNKWLMAVQCIFGPLFCIAVLFGEYFAPFSSDLCVSFLCIVQTERSTNLGYSSPPALPVLQLPFSLLHFLDPVPVQDPDLPDAQWVSWSPLFGSWRLQMK